MKGCVNEGVLAGGGVGDAAHALRPRCNIERGGRKLGVVKGMAVNCRMFEVLVGFASQKSPKQTCHTN